MDPNEKDKEIAAIIERLERQFPGVPPPEVVAVIRAHRSARNEDDRTSLGSNPTVTARRPLTNQGSSSPDHGLPTS